MPYNLPDGLRVCDLPGWSAADVARDTFRDLNIANPDSPYFAEWLECLAEDLGSDMAQLLACLTEDIMALLPRFPGTRDMWDQYLMERFEEES